MSDPTLIESHCLTTILLNTNNIQRPQQTKSILHANEDNDYNEDGEDDDVDDDGRGRSDDDDHHHMHDNESRSVQFPGTVAATATRTTQI
mmetsp:Transcript_34441/g.83049  ORF Transcript_34441/g.83049 Transcript_34441/m.83049 type:complete len:90 (+) Transcript_34441:72-341(+)